MGKDRNLIVVVSNGCDSTAHFLEHKLRARNHRVVRLNTEDLPKARVTICDRTGHCGSFIDTLADQLPLNTVKAVYYRRPNPPSVDPSIPAGMRSWVQHEIRQLWGGILYSLSDVKWVNHPLAISAAGYKPEQLMRAAKYGICLPE